MRAGAVVGGLALMAASCVPANEPPAVDRRTMQPVSLPDLSRLEESVQAQLRERHDALIAQQKDPATVAELGTGYGEMGKLLMAAGFDDPAELALVNAQALVPGDMRWPYYLGHLYRSRGDIPKAVAAFERSLQLAPSDVPTMTWLAEAALDRGRPDTAEALLMKALTLQPRSAAVYYGLGRTALAKKDYVRAAQDLEQALALDGKASVVHYPLAMAYRGLDDQRRAESHLRQRGTVPIQPDPLRQALDDLLHSALTYERNADAAGNRGEWAAAAEYLRKAVVLAPTRASTRHKLGTALFYLRDRRGAFDEFHEALRLSPTFTASHYAIGVMHEEAGEHQQAIDSFSAALTSEPAHIDARLELANALRRSGRLESSLSEYQRILGVDSGAVRAHFGQVAALVRLNRHREAADRLEAAMDHYPDAPAFARVAARLFAAAPDDRVRDGRRAISIVQALLAGQPRTVELIETMAMALAEVGQYGDAVRWQRQAIEAAGQAGRKDVVQRLTDNLARYGAGRPCRTPWHVDEPIEF